MKNVKSLCAHLLFLLSLSLAIPSFAQAETININTATLEQLQEMTGIGKTRAQAIIEYREQHGPFANVEGLLEVDGIGEVTLDRNRSKLAVN